MFGVTGLLPINTLATVDGKVTVTVVVVSVKAIKVAAEERCSRTCG